MEYSNTRTHTLTYNWHKMKINKLFINDIFVCTNTIEYLSMATRPGQYTSALGCDGVLHILTLYICLIMHIKYYLYIYIVSAERRYKFTLKSKNIKRLNRWQTVDNVSTDFNKTIAKWNKKTVISEATKKSNRERQHIRRHMKYWYDSEFSVRLLFYLQMRIGQFIHICNVDVCVLWCRQINSICWDDAFGEVHISIWFGFNLQSIAKALQIAHFHQFLVLFAWLLG